MGTKARSFALLIHVSLEELHRPILRYTAHRADTPCSKETGVLPSSRGLARYSLRDSK